MTSTQTKEGTNRSRPPAVEVTVRNWPLSEGGFSAWVFVAFCAGASYLAGERMENSLVAVGCFVGLAVASWRLWVPAQYTLQGTGIRIESWLQNQRFGWHQFSHAEIGTRGIVLVRSDSISWLSLPRRTYIYWNGRKEEILLVVSTHLECQS